MKKLWKILSLFAFCFIILGFTKTVQANSIEKISMDVYIDNNGNASVTEIWDCQTSSGTEVYHPYYNLGKSKIVNLTVSDSGVDYKSLDSWTTSGSLQSKAQKCGINTVSNGVELCWGISSYGSHLYTVKYTITNFVADLTDYQMVYWTLIPYSFSNEIDDVYIKIHADDAFPDTTPVWGYGNYGGTAYVYDGYIEMQSQYGLDTDEYMTILVRFPKGTFNTNNSLDYDFDYFYEMAEDGSIEYNGHSYSNSSSSSAGGFVVFIIVLLCIIIPKISNGNPNSHKTNTLKKGESGKISRSEINYFKELPCNKDILRAYYVGYHYGLIKRDSNLFGALLLKWIKDSAIKMEKRTSSGLFKSQETVIVLDKTAPEHFSNYQEKSLYNMLYSASKDGILEKREFKNWCKTNYERVLKWFDSVLNHQRDQLVYEGLVTKESKDKSKPFSKNIYTATPELKQEALQLAGLKKYLKDYTLIINREPLEVILFEEYLIFAQLLGIAKKVAKNFNELYPEMIEESNFDSYNDMFFVNTWAHNGISYATTAQTRAESYSSGGGGFSSGGGGGGSFGGGGGGGGFR